MRRTSTARASPAESANGAGPAVCLVSMPFIPATSPGLGISTLKSTLTAVGAQADIYYGALDYFRFF